MDTMLGKGNRCFCVDWVLTVDEFRDEQTCDNGDSRLGCVAIMRRV